MAVVRESDGPVHRTQLQTAWDPPEQRRRCLDSLLADGLLVQPADDVYALPG